MLRAVETVESEWSDQDRIDMKTLEAYEAGVCACGFHESLLDPKTNFYKFEQKTCPVCATSSRYGRILAHDDAEAAADAEPSEPLASDGRRIFLRRRSPAEMALEQLAL